MAEVRYRGDNADGVDLADPQVHLPRMEWVDVPADVARTLAKQDDFELRASVKAAKTRAKNESAEAGSEEK